MNKAKASNETSKILLTEKQAIVTGLWLQGFTIKKCSIILNNTPKTISEHINRVKLKYEAETLPELKKKLIDSSTSSELANSAEEFIRKQFKVNFRKKDLCNG